MSSVLPKVAFPDRQLDTWGRLSEIDRRGGVTHHIGVGVRWTVTFPATEDISKIQVCTRGVSLSPSHTWTAENPPTMAGGSQPASLIRLRTEGGANQVWGLCGGISSSGYPAGECPDGIVELTR